MLSSTCLIPRHVQIAFQSAQWAPSIINPEVSRAKINNAACVECGTYCRGMSTENLNPTIVRAIGKIAKAVRMRFESEPDVCPTIAFEMNELEMTRLILQIFPEPVVEHKSTRIKGMGAEEVKTNDVCLRVDSGEAGYTIEFGRPGVGVRFSGIQEMTMELAKYDVLFEQNNPITHIMKNIDTGEIRRDILNEKIHSAIVEIKTSIDEVEHILALVDKVNGRIDTVTEVGASTRCDEQGEDTQVAHLLEDLGYSHIRAKTNMGLGHLTNKS